MWVEGLVACMGLFRQILLTVDNKCIIVTITLMGLFRQILLDVNDKCRSVTITSFIIVTNWQTWLCGWSANGSTKASRLYADFLINIWGDIWNTQWREVTSSLDSLRMHFKRQKKSNECSQCDFISSQEFEDTFENTQWRKVKQMQHVWLSIYSGRQFENAFESSQCKCKCKCSRCDFTPIKANDWRSHLKIPQRHIAVRSPFNTFLWFMW